MALTGFGGFNQANQAAIMQMQIQDQRQAQSIFRQIATTQGQPVYNPSGHYAPSPSPVQTFQQMGQMMMLLGAMMQSMAQLGAGFSSFLGGPGYSPHNYR
jgi:hypothetical protein